MACICQHVPLQQRLSCCALVCRSWAVIAATEPAHVEADVTDPKKLKQMQAWLHSCGEQVTTLSLLSTHKSYDHRPLLQLACSKLTQLQSLQLKNLTFQLQLRQASTRSSTSSSLALLAQGSPSTSSRAGSPAALLPQLLQLSLVNCYVPEQLFEQLGELTRLTQLSLYNVLPLNRTMRSWQGISVINAVHQQLLQQLQGLVELQLYNVYSSGEDLAPLRSMQHLQRLALTGAEGLGFAKVIDQTLVLPVSLTNLTLTLKGSVGTLRQGVCFSGLTALQQLKIGRWDIHPGVLRGMSGLRHLTLHSLHRQLIQAVAGYSPAELLEVLQTFIQLQHLELHDCGLHTLLPLPAQQQHAAGVGGEGHQQQQQQQQGYHRFAALTASSQLTALKISQTSTDPLPAAAALDYMFSSGRVFNSLRVVAVNKWTCFSISSKHLAVDASNVAGIARCCPYLQELSLARVTDDTFDYSCVLQLPPALTSLNLSVPACSNTTTVPMTPVAAGYVAQLTQLKVLQCTPSWHALETLTALKSLQFDAIFSGFRPLTKSFLDSQQSQVGWMGLGHCDCAGCLLVFMQSRDACMPACLPAVLSVVVQQGV